MRFTVNGKQMDVQAEPDASLLWVIREQLNLTGTKFGCGMAQCGACTVHLDGKAVRSCVTRLSQVENKSVTTIEGLSPDGTHPLQMFASKPRAAAVVRKAAEMAQWDKKRKGRGLGIAFSDTWSSFIATVAEVSVDRKTGKIRVHEMWSAVDPGIAILPDNVIAQIEGGSVFGVSHVLGERITLKNGVVQQSNFHDYPLLRLADTPEIHVHVIATDNPPGGIGEVGLPPTSGAIGNAVAALTGARVRHLPMIPERVLAALRSA